MDAINGNEPFIMKPDGVGWLFAPRGVKDGPLPAHYEPVESPVGNLLHPAADVEPVRPVLRRPPEPDRARPFGRVPGRRLHVPPDRALPERANEPVQ